MPKSKPARVHPAPDESPADSATEGAALARRLAGWQVPVAQDRPARARSKPGAGAFSLAGMDPGATPFSGGDKARDKASVETLATELDVLQNLFYADKRFKLLVVLQGTDTSGKDGTLRGVFGKISPLGVNTTGWKAPTDEERAHDFLWRIHHRAPGAGEWRIFNRSHYEDVLVPAVNGWISDAQTAQRLQHINDFERMLAETGTVILKFMLHIGFDEQRERLQERIDDPDKHWKFNVGDIEVRKQWTQYQQAYERLLGATSTASAPWVVVPANSKTHRNLMIATVVRAALLKLKLRYSPADPKLEHIKIA
ncbi:MAG: polyphosphate--nucleotide phosphotransferase [Polaromonas sp.]|nr:polyphosphate--nucleotide phosphotransferase [Polaromonas sp.]